MVSKIGKRIEGSFRSVWSPSQILFSISLGTFFFFMAVISSLFLVGAKGMQMIYFWVASGVFLALALLTLIRIKMEPDKLDIIIKKIDRLTGSLGYNETAMSDIGEINKQIRENLKQIRDEEGDTMPKSEPQPSLTKKRFERLLKKAAQPISEWKHDQEETETSESHPSDGCSDKHRNQGKTEGKEG